MMVSLLKTTIYIILILFILFFFFGNISLMKLKDETNIRTNYDIQKMLPDQKFNHDDSINNQKIIDDITNYADNLTSETNQTCQSIKNKIINNVRSKQQIGGFNEKFFKTKRSEYEKLCSQTIPSVTSNKICDGGKISLGSSPQFLVSEMQSRAPILKNFEDYAPVDTPMNVPMDKGHVHLNPKNQSIPQSMNEYSTQHPSHFESEYRTPWSGKMGKDDLSYFFDTYRWNNEKNSIQSDQIDSTQKDPINQMKKPIICPVDWENLGDKVPHI